MKIVRTKLMNVIRKKLRIRKEQGNAAFSD